MDNENRKEDYDVSDDHILMSDVMGDHDITAKQLSMLTGRGLSTVHRYCAGGATIPTVIWRTLFKLTKDARIIDLYVGDVPVMHVPVPESTGPVSYKSLIEVRRAHLQVESTILDILEDGKIDEADRDAINTFNKNFPDAIAKMMAIHQAINNGDKTECKP